MYRLLCLLLLFIVTSCSGQPSKENGSSLDSLVGQYLLGRDVLTFTKAGEQLELSSKGKPSVMLVVESGKKFITKSKSGLSVEFVSDENGKIIKVILTQDGNAVEAKRIRSNKNFDPEQKFSVAQLKEDFVFFRSTLEKFHPRLYEFTSKKEFDRLFDSLYTSLKTPMNEIEFRYFLLPAVAKIHCGHTGLSPSNQLSQYHSSLNQPFVLYYEGMRAYVRYSASPELRPGTEVLAINNKPIKSRILNSLERVSDDGIHLPGRYWRMNQLMSWRKDEMPEWFNVQNYYLLVKNADNSQSEIRLKAVTEAEFAKHIPPLARKKNELKIVGQHTAILSYPMLDFAERNTFLNTTFNQLKEKQTQYLIVDLRGNTGGSPQSAVYLLRYLMRKDFIYPNMAPQPNLVELTKPTSVAENGFHGKIYFLIDGGCFSSTGHILSLVKYYNLGPLIGEKSSGTYSCNTIGVPYHLPNTDLTLMCSQGIYETAVKGFDRAKGIPPDHEVKNTFNDLLAGKDRMLDFTLSMIEKGN